MAVETDLVQRSPARLPPGSAAVTDLESIYREMLPCVYGYILIWVRRDRLVAEDLTQETFLAMARSVRDGVTISNPTGWLFGTARFKVIDHLRAHLNAVEDVLPDDDSDIAAGLDQAEFNQVLERTVLLGAIDRLPDIQRIAILLHYTDGLSVREIATLINKTEHAIEAHLVRARRSLRIDLSAQEMSR